MAQNESARFLSWHQPSLAFLQQNSGMTLMLNSELIGRIVFSEPGNVSGGCHLREKDKQVLSPDTNMFSCILKVVCKFLSKMVLEINLDQQINLFTLLSRLNLSITKAINCQTRSNILLIKIQSI